MWSGEADGISLKRKKEEESAIYTDEFDVSRPARE